MGETNGARRLVRWAGLMIGCFFLGFAGMYVAGRLNSRPGEDMRVPSPTVPVVVTDDQVRAFMAAVEQEDFPAMRELGGRLFVPGAVVPKHAEKFSPYATNGTPPYSVYAFFVQFSETSGRRVMLTIRADDVVDSFMAEEMKIVE